MDQFRLGERQAAIGVDEQMAIGWSDVNRGGYQVIAFLGLLDSQRGAPAEDVGHRHHAKRGVRETKGCALAIIFGRMNWIHLKYRDQALLIGVTKISLDQLD